MFVACTLIVASSVNALPKTDENAEIEEQNQQQEPLMIPVINPETGEMQYKICTNAPDCPDIPPTINAEND